MPQNPLVFNRTSTTKHPCCSNSRLWPRDSPAQQQATNTEGSSGPSASTLEVWGAGWIYLIDDFLLLRMLLPQTGHFPPQCLILTARKEKAISLESTAFGAEQGDAGLSLGNRTAGFSRHQLTDKLLGTWEKLFLIHSFCSAIIFTCSESTAALDIHTQAVTHGHIQSQS